MKVNEVKKLLLSGKTLDEIFELTEGQDCMIYKAENFSLTDDVIYIPDVGLNDLLRKAEDTEEETAEAIANDIVDSLYTGNDFLYIVDGKRLLAERLFYDVDWQHPGSVIDAGELDGEEVVYCVLGEAGFHMEIGSVLNALKDYDFTWGFENPNPTVRVSYHGRFVGDFTASELIAFAEVESEEKTPRVVVIIEDGIIQSVLSDSSKVNVEIVDLDRDYDNYEELSEHIDGLYKNKYLRQIPYNMLAAQNNEE